MFDAPAPPERPADWRGVPSRYRVAEIIGSGVYSTTCEAEDTEANPARAVALKKRKRVFRDRVDCQRILREIGILTQLSHPNVVRVFDLVLPDGPQSFKDVYVIMEICDSDLNKLMKQDVALLPSHVSALLYSMLVGLNYIHSAGVYHCDLKPANCLVNDDCTMKIGGFCLARAIGGETEHSSHSPDGRGEDLESKVPRVPRAESLQAVLTRHVVARWYRAPELILLQRDHSDKVDVWSAGCIYAELLGMLQEGRHYMDRGPLFPGPAGFPTSLKQDCKFKAHGKHDQLARIFDVIGTPSEAEVSRMDGEDARVYVGSFPKLEGSGFRAMFPSVDPKSIELLEQTLKFNPKERVRVRDALSHPLFADIRDVSTETTAKQLVVLDFERDDAPDLDEPNLRKNFATQVRKFHPEAPEF